MDPHECPSIWTSSSSSAARTSASSLTKRSTVQSAGFGCYDIDEPPTLDAIKTTALFAAAYVLSGKDWDYQRESDANIPILEAIAQARTDYRIGMRDVDEQELELDLNERVGLKTIYRPYQRLAN